MKKNVYVIGAGASCEYGFPSGVGLKGRISSELNLDNIPEFLNDPIQRYFKKKHASLPYFGSFIRKQKQISQALPMNFSIDNFLNNIHNDDEMVFIGKATIAKIILEHERQSGLYPGSKKNDKFWKLGESWLFVFFSFITEQCNIEQLEDRLSSIGMIIFNYDRCVEHFLFLALQINYGVNSERAAELVNCIEIYHPYGMLGSLPSFGKSELIPFGHDPFSSGTLFSIAKNINTFTEGIEQKDSLHAIQNIVEQAKKLIFLGFAFHPMNMDVLFRKRKTKEKGPELIFGTTFGMSEDNQQEIFDRLVKVHRYQNRTRKNSIKLQNLTCSDFFDYYSFGLSLINE